MVRRSFVDAFVIFGHVRIKTNNYNPTIQDNDKNLKMNLLQYQVLR